MITKKLWNSFSVITKTTILETYYACDLDSVPSRYKKLLEPYNHDFDYDLLGKKLKEILSTCYLQKDGSINVVYNFKPQYLPKSTSTVVKKATPKVAVEPQKSTYYIDYRSTEDEDICHVWCEATSVEEAKDYIKHEYWDVKEIINVRIKR